MQGRSQEATAGIWALDSWYRVHGTTSGGEEKRFAFTI